MSELTIGIAGLGQWGKNYLATLSLLPGCRVTAVADPVVSRVDGLPVYRTGQEMLKHCRLDAVVIATPEPTHFPLAQAALDSGRHVLVEKPMALTMTEARFLNELASHSGLVLAVGHTPLYSLGFRRLSKTVQTGLLGPIKKLKADRTSAGPRTKLGLTDSTHNPIWDLAVHDLAMAIQLLGPPSAGSARYNSNQEISYTISFSSGATLTGRASWQKGPITRKFTVLGTLGQASCSDRSLGQRFASRPLTRQCLDFIRACRNHSPPLSNSELGLLVTNCACALSTSARDGGRWTPIPLTT